MAKYRMKPLVIDAIQFTGDNVNEIWEAFGAGGIYGPTETNPDFLILTMSYGTSVYAVIGDWVIPDLTPNTFYSIANDVFEAKYDRVTVAPHEHKPVRHRDGFPPWCKICGLSGDAF